MTRMTGPDCAVMCNLINIHTYIKSFVILQPTVLISPLGWMLSRFRCVQSDLHENIPLSYTIQYVSVCVFCVFCSHSFWTSSSLDVPAGVTQEEGHIGFFIHLTSAMRALIFIAKRIQPFLSLVDREVELGILFFILFLVRKIPFAGIELTSQRVRRLRGYL